MMTSTLIRDKDNFLSWLMQERSISERAARDCFSRCKRVESELNLDLSIDISTVSTYAETMLSIREYAYNLPASNKVATQNLAGGLRGAVKKYAEFKFPTKSLMYPAFHKHKYQLK